MSTSHEPSYYEIALTNRQVLVAFVILLACLVAAFLSGAWIGRDGLDTELTASIDPQGQGEAAEEAQFGDLNFFLEDPKTGGGEDGEEPVDRRLSVAEIAEEATPETTLRDDLKGPAGSEEARRPAPSESERAPDPVPPPIRRPTRDETAEDQSARATPREPVKLEAAPIGGGSDASAARSGFVIQVFSTADKAQAERVIGDLTRSGFDTFLSPVEVSNRTMYRVRVGPFADRARADQVAAEVQRRHRLDTWVTQQ